MRDLSAEKAKISYRTICVKVHQVITYSNVYEITLLSNVQQMTPKTILP